jgi:hypothetical protein
MNYLFRNAKKEWEPLRMFTFRKFTDGVYYRDAVLESNPALKLQLADLPLDNGILRIDLNTSTDTAELHLGHYALPQKNGPITEKTIQLKGCTVRIIDNGEYQLALVALQHWGKTSILTTNDLHPVSTISKVLEVTDTFVPDNRGPKLCATLMLWKKSGAKWSKSDLMPVRKISLQSGKKIVDIEMVKNIRKTVVFD